MRIHKLAVWICNRARIPDRRLSDGHGLEQDGGRTLEGQPSMDDLLPSIADCCPRNASTAEHPAPSLVSLALHTSAAGHCFWTLRAGGTNYCHCACGERSEQAWPDCAQPCRVRRNFVAASAARPENCLTCACTRSNICRIVEQCAIRGEILRPLPTPGVGGCQRYGCRLPRLGPEASMSRRHQIGWRRQDSRRVRPPTARAGSADRNLLGSPQYLSDQEFCG